MPPNTLVSWFQDSEIDLTDAVVLCPKQGGLHRAEVIYTVQGEPSVTRGETEETCEASTATVSPEVGDTVGLCYCEMHRWTLARSPG